MKNISDAETLRMMGISPLGMFACHSGDFGPVYLPFTQLTGLMPILGTPGQAKELWLEMWFGTKLGSLKVKDLLLLTVECRPTYSSA